VIDVGCIRMTVRQICMRDIAFSSLRIALVVGTGSQVPLLSGPAAQGLDRLD
jgi:hypothetical protein